MGFKFQNFDFLSLDTGFTEDELLVRRTARDFVEDNIVPIIEDCFREGRFPRALVPLIGQLGFFGASLEGCSRLTEPGLGSNPGGMTTTARRSGEEYIRNGEKISIPSGSTGVVAVICA